MALKRFIPGLLLCVSLSAALCACGKTGGTVAADKKESAEENKDSTKDEQTLEPESSETPNGGITPESSNDGTDDKDRQLFTDFIEGKISAVIDDNLTNELSLVCMKEQEKDGKTISKATFDGLFSISIDELTKLVAESPNLDTSGMKGAYACIDGDSGEKALAVKYKGVGLDGAGDESGAYFVFIPENRKLKMAYCRDSSARRYCQMNEGLIFTGYSNQGAGDSVEWCGMIRDGAYKQLYSVETLSDDWVAMYDENADIDDTEWSRGCTLELVEVEEGTFYFCKADGSVDQKKLKGFLKMLEEKGMRKTENDAASFMQSALNAADIKEGVTIFDGWEPINTDEASEGQSNLQAGNICVFGTVKEVTDEGLLIDNKSDASSQGDMLLTVSIEDTKIMDASEGTPASLSDIAAGDTIYAYTGDAMAMSLPPQVNADVIFCRAPQDYKIPSYVVVKTKSALDDGLTKIIAENGGEFVFNDKTSVFPYRTKNIVEISDIKEGSRCVIWSDDGKTAMKCLLFGE